MRIILPDERQRADHDCGLAAMRTVLKYWGYAPRLSANLASEIDGTNPRTIESVFRKMGFSVMSGNMEADHLRAFLRKARPIICAIESHYVVISSVARKWIEYQCPSDGPKREVLDTFVERWHDYGGWGEAYSQFGICAWI